MLRSADVRILHASRTLTGLTMIGVVSAVGDGGRGMLGRLWRSGVRGAIFSSSCSGVLGRVLSAGSFTAAAAAASCGSSASAGSAGSAASAGAVFDSPASSAKSLRPARVSVPICNQSLKGVSHPSVKQDTIALTCTPKKAGTMLMSTLAHFPNTQTVCRSLASACPAVLHKAEPQFHNFMVTIVAGSLLTLSSSMKRKGVKVGQGYKCVPAQEAEAVRWRSGPWSGSRPAAGNPGPDLPGCRSLQLLPPSGPSAPAPTPPGPARIRSRLNLLFGIIFFQFFFMATIHRGQGPDTCTRM